MPAPRAEPARAHSNPFRWIVSFSLVFGIRGGRLDRRGPASAGSLPWIDARLPLPALRLSREQFRAQRAPPAAWLLAVRLRLLVRAARGLLREPQDRADRVRQGAAD